MIELVRKFADQLEEAMSIGRDIEPPSIPQKIEHVVLGGVGGSAFGGEVVKCLLASSCPIPFIIHRDYDLPSFVGPQSLVIISSYSGNTEETLSAFHAALEKKANIVCITSGGIIRELAEEKGITCVQVPSGFPPRAAAGFSLVVQLFLLKKLGLMPEIQQDLDQGIEQIRNFDQHSLAEETARYFRNSLPIVYCSPILEPVAIRIRQQIQENAKQLAFHHLIPEMNHNELVGWKNPHDLIRSAAPLILRSHLDHPRNSMRAEINQGIISQSGSRTKEIWAPKGISHLAQLLYLIHFADWVSLFLANLNQEDPLPVSVIDFLKGELGKK